ncbi:hypothetical protein [Methanosarcina barkeri]|uniref:hypothetical protein n=1 Tax=Methanosarcina barkeri TaxID=2208 RepID=UPI000ADF36E8|nr:hypothetical protein [Methanosarcina barkeri]
MSIKELFSNILLNSQTLSLFSLFNGFNHSKTQKIIQSHVTNDCIYHKYWYEPVNNDSSRPKHIQIDRCTFGLLATGGCNTECESYISYNRWNTCNEVNKD